MGNGPANVEKGIQRGMTQQSHVVLFHSYPFLTYTLDPSFVSLSLTTWMTDVALTISSLFSRHFFCQSSLDI